jgi:hypothetical protein
MDLAVVSLADETTNASAFASDRAALSSRHDAAFRAGYAVAAHQTPGSPSQSDLGSDAMDSRRVLAAGNREG